MNNTMVREIRGAKINPKSSFKNEGTQNTWGRKLRKQIRYIYVPLRRHFNLIVGQNWVRPAVRDLRFNTTVLAKLTQTGYFQDYRGHLMVWQDESNCDVSRSLTLDRGMLILNLYTWLG